jgi:hypothetical protein
MEKLMIRSEKGVVEINGTRMTLINELTCIIKSFVEDEVIEPTEIFDIISVALRDEGVLVVRGSEEDLAEILGGIGEELKSESPNSDEIEDDDSDEADDIFKFLRGDK